MTTPTPSSAPSSAGVQYDLSGTLLQIDDHTQAVATSVEEDFLLCTFGVSIPRDPTERTDELAARIAQEVARRVVTVIDGTRSALTAVDIEHLLSPMLQRRLSATLIDAHHDPSIAVRDTLHARRVRAVIESIRESLPENIMNDVLRYGIPVYVPKDAEQPAHKLILSGIAFQSLHPATGIVIDPSSTVEIDLRHEFWRNTEPSTLITELQNQIKAKKTLEALGIYIRAKPPLPESFVLDAQDATEIVQKGVASGIDVNKRFDVLQHVYTAPSGARIAFTVDTAKLVRHVVSNPGSPPPATVRFGQLNNVLDIGNALKTYPSATSLFITTEPFDAMDPASTLGAIHSNAIDDLATRLLTDGILPAIESLTLETVQKEIHEQHRFFENMRKGSDNHMAAALATKWLMEHKDLRDVLDKGDISKLMSDLDLERRRQQLCKLLVQASSITFTPAFSWQIAIDTLKNFSTEIVKCSTGGSIIDLGGQHYTIPTPCRAADETAARQWANDRRKEAVQVCAESQSLCSILTAIRAQALAIDSGVVLEVINVTPALKKKPNYSMYNRSSLNLNTILDEVRRTYSLGISSDELHAKKITELLDKINLHKMQSQITGAEAQHKVLTAELMRYHGLTDNEAHQGANVLRARALLDTDMSVATQRMADEQFGHDAHLTEGQHIASVAETVQRGDFGLYGWNPLNTANWGGGRRDLRMIQNIAHECHIPLSSREGAKPLWAQAQSYEDLLTAFHTLKKVRFQKYYDRTSEVPWDVRIRATAGLDQDMREISRALFLFHAKGLLQEYGPSVGLKDGDAEKILAEPTKPEHERILRQIIEGPPHADIALRMGHVIEHAAGRTQRVRRFVSSTLFGKDWGVVTGGKLPFSYRALIYGNPTFSLKGGWDTLKNVGHNISHNKKSLLWAAIATGLTANPFAGLAASAYTWKTPPPMTQTSNQGGGSASHGQH